MKNENTSLHGLGSGELGVIVDKDSYRVYTSKSSEDEQKLLSQTAGSRAMFYGPDAYSKALEYIKNLRTVRLRKLNSHINYVKFNCEESIKHLEQFIN